MNQMYIKSGPIFYNQGW